MSAFIPPDEQAHYDAARAAQVERDVAAVDPEKEAVAARDQADREAHVKQVQAWAAAVLSVDPDMWAVVQDRVLPRPGTAAMLMKPSADMTFGETAAYKMGQQSIIDWLYTTAVSTEAPPAETPHEEAHHG